MANNKQTPQVEELETREWLESLDYVFHHEGPEHVRALLRRLQVRAQEYGVVFYCPGNTPFINTIPAEKQPPFPGSREIERRIKRIIRWNAMAMVVRANRLETGIGGHISTYASVATLFEIGFNHFFRGKGENHDGDIIYFQGHAAPGIYARAFLEGRLSEKDLENFRRELKPEGGLSSYPHPWLMPDFWEFPTVSMGLSPIMAIYQARFNRYLEDRGLKKTSDQRVWAFLGDGEMDEPESLGAITLAAREKLDNLIFVINCNLQRLDGPVRGNGKIIQELEAAFRGAGWNVIKVIWGSDWDPLFAKDKDGILVKHLEELVDGESQKHAVASGDYIRKNFFSQDPRLLELVKNYSDEQLRKLRRGGHDPEKVYAAYKAAVDHKGSPTVGLLAGQQMPPFKDQSPHPLRCQDGHPGCYHCPVRVPPQKSSLDTGMVQHRQHIAGRFLMIVRPKRRHTGGTTIYPAVRNNQANTWTTGAQDMGSATSLIVPKASGAAPTADGDIRYDTTQKRYVAGGAGGLTGSFPRVLKVVNCSTSGTCSTEANASGTGGDMVTDDTSTTNEVAPVSSQFTIPANTLVVNKAYRLEVLVQTDAVASPANATIRLCWGGVSGTVLMAANAAAP
ncbi:MAG: hypothetical protein ABIN58_04450, partial [candidate division WOR-3 bacterium]